jgi:NADH:ubiquinone oxidoreductase subunit D
MMDCVVPGGVTVDLDTGGAAGIRAGLQEIHRRFPRLVELYDNTASLQDRTVATGIVTAELARQFSASGYVGRASGRNVDARKTPGYAPYDQLDFAVPVFTAGDVDARVWVRIREVEQSLAVIEQILTRLPDGPIRVPLTDGAGEGLRKHLAIFAPDLSFQSRLRELHGILDACQDAWRKLRAEVGRIASIATRDWATIRQSF